MGMLTKLLLEEHGELKEEDQEIRKRISEAERRLREVTERLTHVEGLLGPSQVFENASSEESLSRSLDIKDIAADVLGAREGEPMYYKDLAKEIQARGGNLTGPNAANVLVARLVSDDRFVRPTRRGYYALRRDYPDAKNVGARKRRLNGDNGQNEKGKQENGRA